MTHTESGSKRSFSAVCLVILLSFALGMLVSCATSRSSSGGSGSGGSGSGGAGGSGGSGGGSGSGGSGGGGPTQNQTARFVYATESTANKVAGFTVNSSNGALTATTQATIVAGTTPVRAAADIVGMHLYVANQGSNNVSAYSIGKDGTLTPVAGSPFALGGPGVDVFVQPAGKFVYVAFGSSKGGTQGVAAFSIAGNGALTPVAGSPFTISNAPNALIVDPSGKYLYVASGQVAGFSIDQTSGALTPVPGSPFQPVGPAGCPVCAGPTMAFNLAIDPSGAHLYTADGFAGSVDAFNIDPASGTLTHMQGAPFVDRMPTGQSMDPAFNPYGIAIDGRGRFLYGYDSGDNDISIFAINSSTGALGPVQKTANTFGGVCAGQILRADPSGNFLYGLGTQNTGCKPPAAVLGFSINQSNGTLTPTPGDPYPANVFPFNDGIALVP